MTKAKWTVIVAALLLWAGTVFGQPTAQERCDGARIKAWRTYVSCVENVLGRQAGGLPVNPGFFEAMAKCRHKYFNKWNALQGGAYTGSTCVGTRFTDNSDGTVTDNLSMLTWEKKTDDGSVHDWDDLYTWTTGAPYKENGTAFTSFLSTVNSGGGLGGSNGWRLPTLAELQTIVLDFECSAASCTCPSTPCVDPALEASTTQPAYFWSVTSSVPAPDDVLGVGFSGGQVGVSLKTFTGYVRTVRGGL